MNGDVAESTMQGRLAILGGGRMGEALLSGLLRSGHALPEQIHVTVRSAARAAQLAAEHGVGTSTDSRAAAKDADVIIVAVKPQNMRELLEQIGSVVGPEQTVVSVAAGITTATIEQALRAGVPVVRVMSNVPVQVDEAMSAIAGGSHATARHLDLAEGLLRPVGKVVQLPEEHLDAVTALSGSGPAYFFLLAEAMIDAGILLGLSRDVATELIIQTMVGSAIMLRDSGRHPVELRESVTSPGGTTISAIRVLEEERVRAAFLNAIEAAKNRSRELAGG
jgi:pyrroline-5-carboxylate reductase